MVQSVPVTKLITRVKATTSLTLKACVDQTYYGRLADYLCGFNAISNVRYRDQLDWKVLIVCVYKQRQHHSFIYLLLGMSQTLIHII